MMWRWREQHSYLLKSVPRKIYFAATGLLAFWRVTNLFWFFSALKALLSLIFLSWCCQKHQVKFQRVKSWLFYDKSFGEILDLNSNNSTTHSKKGRIILSQIWSKKCLGHFYHFSISIWEASYKYSGFWRLFSIFTPNILVIHSVWVQYFIWGGWVHWFQGWFEAKGCSYGMLRGLVMH